MNLHKFHSSRDGFHLRGGLCLPCIRSLCLTEIPGTRSAVSLGITLSHRKFCQNAHFQTSESRLDVHTHFWFFHFCRLNRELFLGHVISSAEAGSARHSRDARAGARGARKAPSTGRISSLRSRATTRGGEGPGYVGSRLDHARNRQGGAKDST